MMNKILKQITEDYDIILIMKFGSQLYGTNTPESDTDYKGIFIPTKEQILLQEIPKYIKADTKDKHATGKNTKDDIDIELYSLSYFIELCLKGETVGIDMLHCNDDNIVYKKKEPVGDYFIWDYIRDYRSKFYTNNLKGFVGYCRKQAAKYGIKGSRISDARKVLRYLDNFEMSHEKLGDIWSLLPRGEHIHFIIAKTHGDREEEFYQVCGKKLQKTAKISYCIGILEKFIEQYGYRALLAEKNQGVDWKALSHALRYGYQIKELFQTGDIKFPLKQRKFLTKVKKGDIHYKKVVVCLESLIDHIEKVSKGLSCTKFPSKPDGVFWREFIYGIYENIIK